MLLFLKNNTSLSPHKRGQSLVFKFYFKIHIKVFWFSVPRDRDKERRKV
jgi:hypothetical protein